jgi:large subunit ribosomal protein L19
VKKTGNYWLNSNEKLQPSTRRRTVNPLIRELNEAQMKTELPQFNVGDTVRVHFRIVEGEKERVQVYEGVCISRKGGTGPNATFTVRRVAFGEGVERVFPLHSPRVEKVQVTREGEVRRAKLYYLRDRMGKAARVKAKSRSTKTKAAAVSE